MNNHFPMHDGSNAAVVSYNLLRFFVQKLSLGEYLDSVVYELKKWTGCSCIGVRVLNNDGYIPYLSTDGFDEQFLKRENNISIYKDECICIRAVRGEQAPWEGPIMTGNGSMCCMNSGAFVANLTDDQKRIYRGVCLEYGFKTICVFPVRYQDTILGAIHLADKRESLLTLEIISAMESTAVLVGEAILRYNLENDLADSEKRYRSLVDNSLSGVYLVQKGKIKYSNRAFADIHGYDEGEIIGIDSLETIHPEDRYLVEEFRSRREQGEKSPNEYEIRAVKKNGEDIWVHRRNVLIEYGGEPAILGYEIDITEQKKNENALKENQELLENIFSNIHFLVAYMDSGFDFIRVNKAYAEADGKSPDFFTGKNHFSLYPNEENETIFRKVIETGKPFFVYAKPFEYADNPERGTTYWDWSLQPVKDAAGKVTGVVLSLVNVTERKRAEEAFKVANKELLKKTKELERSNNDLQEFAFVASHDLQEPLRKIFTFSNMLAERCSSSLDDTSKDYLMRMQRGAKRMRDLLNSLLEYSRVNSNIASKQETDLNKSLKSALSNLEILLNDKNAIIETCNLPTIKADRSQMVQLFQNLIANALKFQTENNRPYIKIHAEKDNELGSLTICLEDNGIGFDESALNKIFAPFQRLFGRSAYEGTGMGLAICKKIVERHGGRITAKSQPGKGTTFLFTLPSL